MNGELRKTSMPLDEYIRVLEKQRSLKVIAERNQKFIYRQSEPGNVITTGRDITTSVPIVEEAGSMILIRCNDRGEPYMRSDGYPQVEQIKKEEFDKNYTRQDDGICRSNNPETMQTFIQANRKARLRYRENVYFVEEGDYINISNLNDPKSELYIVTKAEFSETYTVIKQIDYKTTRDYMEEQGYKIASRRQLAEEEQLENEKVGMTKAEAYITNQDVDPADLDER